MSREESQPEIDEEKSFYDTAAILLAEGVGKKNRLKLREKLSSKLEVFGNHTSEKFKRYKKVAIVGTLALSAAYITFSDQFIDLLGDRGREATAEERKQLALDLYHKETLRNGKVVPPNELFIHLYGGYSERVTKFVEGNGVYGREQANITVPEVVFDDCLSSYIGDTSEFIENGSSVTYQDDDTATLHVYGKGESADLTFGYIADNKNESGFNLIPADLETGRTLGIMGCEGYFNPITGKIN